MSTVLLEQQTVLPPAPNHARDALDKLAAVLTAQQGQGHAALVGPGGDRIELPAEVYEALRQVVAALKGGYAITLAPHTTKLTTQQAADLLNISRPTLVGILERGEIAFEKVGRHRRVMLSDVLEYQQRAKQKRQETLREMTQEAEDLQHVDGFDFTGR
ncbi:helix-turn-helix domain-containing protein [Kutzneria sp. NPDC051319]|uniref:helix-turn-helix domain-containing protein n=1 Tax=Kutzneria sp. NPDC051319 TaxID=3155047 RepID=UPI00344090A7